MDLTQALLIGLAAVVMAWFALGVIWNIRRGNAVLKWMQTGLPRLGERTTLRWLGSSAVTLNIAKAKAPFRRVELLLVLEPRDVPWFWLASRFGGRRDVLIIRGQLASPPRYEYDVLAPGSWSERERLGRGSGRDWAGEAMDGASFRAPAATQALSRAIAPDALRAARRLEPQIWRLSARREYPQLELHIPLPDPRRRDAEAFFAELRALAEKVSSAARP